MRGRRVCVFTGGVSAKETSLLVKYALMGCTIAFMEKNERLGRRIKEELERTYQISVFFFHGDVNSDEDRDLFKSAVQEMYGGVDYIICNND